MKIHQIQVLKQLLLKINQLSFLKAYILPIEWDITLGINSVKCFSPIPIFSKSFKEMCFVGGGSVTFSLSQSGEEE